MGHIEPCADLEINTGRKSGAPALCKGPHTRQLFSGKVGSTARLKLSVNSPPKSSAQMLTDNGPLSMPHHPDTNTTCTQVLTDDGPLGTTTSLLLGSSTSERARCSDSSPNAHAPLHHSDNSSGSAWAPEHGSTDHEGDDSVALHSADPGLLGGGSGRGLSPCPTRISSNLMDGPAQSLAAKAAVRGPTPRSHTPVHAMREAEILPAPEACAAVAWQEHPEVRTWC